MYLVTHCNRGSKRAFPTGVLDRWHNCLLIYWRTSCLVAAFDDRPTWCHVTATEWCQRSLPCYLLLFSNSVRFSSMSEARQLQQRTWFAQYRTSNVAENVGITFFVRGVQSRGKTNWITWLIITAKMEIRHPVEGYLGSEFSVIRNHCGVMCGVMAAWSCKTLKFYKQFFCVFWKIDPLR